MAKHNDAIELIKDKLFKLEGERTRVNDKLLLAQKEVQGQERELEVIDRQIERLKDSRRALEFDIKVAPGA